MEFMEDWFGDNWWKAIVFWLVIVVLIWKAAVWGATEDNSQYMFKIKILFSIIMLPIVLLIVKAMSD